MINADPTIVTVQFKLEHSGYSCATHQQYLVMSQAFHALWTPQEGAPNTFPCVDCGLVTGNFCDGGISVKYDKCFAAERVPQDYANTGGLGRQRTPLCSYCETTFGYCRFCRGVESCTPPSRRNHWSGVPSHLSRSFDSEQHALALAAEFSIREAVARERAAQAQAEEVDQQQTDTVLTTLAL